MMGIGSRTSFLCPAVNVESHVRDLDLGAVLLTRGSTPAGPQPLSQEDVIACTFDGISLVEDIIAAVQDKSDEWTRQLTALIPRPR